MISHYKAIVLLSGGLDSTVTLYWAKSKGYNPLCLIFDYGQRQRKEIFRAVKIAEGISCPYQVVRFKLPWGGSALTDRGLSIPEGRSLDEMRKEIPATYVPARNTIFLSFALSFAEAIGADSIFIGANAQDYSGYPDCRPEYYQAFREVAQRGTKFGLEGKKIEIYTPLIRKSKGEIVKLGAKLKVPFALTWSCYKGGRKPCGRCDSCLLRKRGFQKAGIKDPLQVNSK